MDNLPLLIVVGIAALIGGYALYERFGPTRCQQCGKRGGNKLVSEEVITREPTTITRSQTEDLSLSEQRRKGRRTDIESVQVPALKLTIRRAYRCPHCGYEYTAVDEKVTTDLSA
jgi:hypothetical protein